VLDEAVAARYVKVKTDYNERDERYRAVDRSEYREAASKMIRVYYYVDQRSEEYGYDAAGNRKRFELSYSGAEGESREYVYYPGGNRLAGDGRYAYAYDENGNLRAKGTRLVVAGQSVAAGEVSDWSRYESSLYGEKGSPVFSGDGSLREYEYDLLNRLVRVKVDGVEVAGYRYDAQGLRVEKESDEGSRYYVFDLSGNVVWEEGEQESLTYVYVGGKRFALEEVREGERNRYYYHSDHLGSTVLVTGEDGKAVWDGDYTPFGRLYDERGGKDHTVQFTGKEYDGDSGLYYFNARWYEADLGRFISEDPARDGGNWYVYAGNNPLRYVDPSGMFLEKVKEKVRGAIDRIKESWDRGVERQKEIRENRKHTGTDTPSTWDNILEGFRYTWKETTELPHEVSEGVESAVGAASKLPAIVAKGVGDSEEGLREATSMVLSNLGGIGDIKDILEVFSGQDWVAGKELSKQERIITGITAAMPVVTGPLLRKAVKAFGSEGKLVNGVRVLQDDSLINPNLVDKRGMTNLERMQKGYAPIGPDGKPINLHHVDQTMTGPVQEMTQTFHQQNYVELHPNTGQAASQIDRNAFGVWRSDYWTTRSGDF
jgi:RHS repeat-associated protein